MTSTAVLALAAGFTHAGVATTVAQFDLLDHPDGSAAEPYYGLRLDNVIASGTATLSMDVYQDTVMTVTEEDGDFTIEIEGTLRGGAVSGNAWVDAQDYAVSFSYGADVVMTASGWKVNGFTTLNGGTITNLGTMDTIELFGKGNGAGDTFIMQADGHRLSGDSSSWVGRGWLTTETDGSNAAGGAQDWLFTAIEREAPTPGALALLGLGGLVGARRRR